MMKFLHALTLFATVGLALAREFFLSLGFQADFPTIGAFGLAITTLLIFRGLLPIIAVALLCVMVSLSPETLAQNGLDHEMLLAIAVTIVLYPWLRKMAAND